MGDVAAAGPGQAGVAGLEPGGEQRVVGRMERHLVEPAAGAVEEAQLGRVAVGLAARLARAPIRRRPSPASASAWPNPPARATASRNGRSSPQRSRSPRSGGWFSTRWVASAVRGHSGVMPDDSRWPRRAEASRQDRRQAASSGSGRRGPVRQPREPCRAGERGGRAAERRREQRLGDPQQRQPGPAHRQALQSRPGLAPGRRAAATRSRRWRAPPAARRAPAATGPATGATTVTRRGGTPPRTPARSRQPRPAPPPASPTSPLRSR